MVRAWYIDNDPNDQRLEHHRNPPEFLKMNQVFQVSGVQYFFLNINTYNTDGSLDVIKSKKGLIYDDELTYSKEILPNYQEKLKILFTEHLHADEEIRFVTEGCAYFDVRDKNDEWVRIEVVVGDMIILPKGIYHRFTLNQNNFVKMKRFFTDKLVWTAHNRPAEHVECRKHYLENLRAGFVAV